MSLRQFLRSSKAIEDFRQMESAFPRRFADPLALVEFLGDRTAGRGERDTIYRFLLVEAQARSAVAIALLWLGLWAGLDRIYRQNYRHYLEHVGELVSDLGTAFTAAVQAARLEHIDHLAATLIWNTERRLTCVSRFELCLELH